MDKAQLQEALSRASPSERQEILAVVEELDRRERRELCQADFLEFVKYIWPEFIEGEHHRRIAKLFEDIAEGRKKRVIINLAPRHGKSEFASYLFPAWFLGRSPDKKVMQISNTAELAEGFGRKVRNLLETPEYQEIFPDVTLRADSKASGRWNTNHNGDYNAAGIGAALVGKGAHLAVVDDPHDEQEALSAILNPGIYDKTFAWYTSGVRQRLQPQGSILIVQTRWSLRDLTGQVLERSLTDDKIDKWEVFEFPAILPSGRPLWPEFWDIAELEAVRAEIGPNKFNCQYQQHPTTDENAIIKRSWWKTWDKPDPPKNIEYTLMSWDCAFEAKQTADFSAMTLWGVWSNEEDNDTPNVILLDMWRGRLEFPELKAKALELYKEHEPDGVIIEKKASGAPLLAELRRMGIPAQEFTPSKGNDKIARLNSISDVFASGRVWAPARRFAEEVIEEIAAFPNSRHDDLTDSTSQALIRIRKGGMVGTRHDKEDEEDWYLKSRRAAYY